MCGCVSVSGWRPAVGFRLDLFPNSVSLRRGRVDERVLDRDKFASWRLGGLGPLAFWSQDFGYRGMLLLASRPWWLVDDAHKDSYSYCTYSYRLHAALACLIDVVLMVNEAQSVSCRQL